MEIDHGVITMFPQSLEEYLAYKEQQLDTKLKHNVKIEREKKHLQKFVDRFSAKASKASQAQSKLKQIQKLKTIEILHPMKSAKIRIPKIEEKFGIALAMEEATIGYPDKTVAKDISLDIERGEHIAVLGDNGQGKSTFLKTIAGELELLEGKMRWGTSMKIGYYAQHVLSMLDSDEKVKNYLARIAPQGTSEQEIFEMAGNFLFKDEALKKQISVLSGGEKARLCLVRLLLEKNHVLLLDEPTNHLDFETVEALASALQEANCTVIFVSHNRTFVEILANGIVEVNNGQVKRYLHNYEDYVYHLDAKIEKDLAGGSSKPESKKSATVTTNPRASRIQLKELNKQIKKVEKELSQVAEEKNALLKWFEENYKKFSQEKNEQLAHLNKTHEELEAKWVELQLKIDAEAA